MGISTRSTTIRIYMFSTGLATLAGIVFSIHTQAGYALAGVGVVLDAIASVVIGGTLLSGASERYWDALAWRFRNSSDLHKH
ncbi:ABC transporter permease subunit [Shigella flexneri]